MSVGSRRAWLAAALTIVIAAFAAAVGPGPAAAQSAISAEAAARSAGRPADSDEPGLEASWLGKVLHQISFMLASGATVKMDAVLDGGSAGPTSPQAAAGETRGLGEGLASGLRFILEASFSREPRFSLLSIERVPPPAAASRGGSPTAGDAALLSRCAERGATAVLLVSLERYESGGGQMLQFDARLYDLATRQEIASDAVWALVSASGQKAVFVDGARQR